MTTTTKTTREGLLTDESLWQTPARRFKPIAVFAPFSRPIHEIRWFEGGDQGEGRAEYWVQPVVGDEGKAHSVIRFGHAPLKDFELGVAAGAIHEITPQRHRSLAEVLDHRRAVR